MVFTALLLLLLGLELPWERRRRLLWIGLLAVLLSAIQWVPTVHRLTGSPRGEGLGAREALVWSLPPQRLVELALPRFYGDPYREKEGLYLGWGVHDQDFPYVLSIYPGLLVLSLGLGALGASKIPYRRAWVLAVGCGLLLAFGRYDPLYRWLLEWQPRLGIIRYPEKFVLLSMSALAVAAALGWDLLLRKRGDRGGGARLGRLSLAVAWAATALASLHLAWLFLAPQMAADFVASHSGYAVSIPFQMTALGCLRRESGLSLAFAAGVVLLLLLARRRTVTSTGLAWGASVLLLVDLLHFASGSTPVRPAAEILRPPRIWEDARPLPRRVYTDGRLAGKARLRIRREEPGAVPLLSRFERLEPYVGNLWGIQYVAHEDFDRMATAWARHVESALGSLAGDRDLEDRFLGAWDVAEIAEARPVEALLRDKLEKRPMRAVTRRDTAYRQARWRIPERVTFHATPEEALAAARRGELRVLENEHLVAADRRGSLLLPPGEILEAGQSGGSISLSCRSEAATFLILAVTYDEGWRAVSEGRELPIYPTALGQMAVAFPGGQARVDLTFHQTGLLPGGIASLGGLLLLTILWLRRRDSRSGTIPP